MSLLPPAVNFHINRHCNARCRFCFATFRDVSGQLSLAEAMKTIDLLHAAGAEKLNFAGGEPTLHPQLGALLRHAHGLGLVTSVVTNGARLERLLLEHAEVLDWAGLSVDSAREDVEVALGRSRGQHVAQSVRLAEQCRAAGVRVKLNTVVTTLNAEEDLSGLVRQIAPERWKVFQVLPMLGQNEGAVEPLLISAEAFDGFVRRHEPLRAEGLAPVVEDNDTMRGSYAMIDPAGRFFGNATGAHVYSDPIVTFGVAATLAQVGFVPHKFEGRGGRYTW